MTTPDIFFNSEGAGKIICGEGGGELFVHLDTKPIFIITILKFLPQIEEALFVRIGFFRIPPPPILCPIRLHKGLLGGANSTASANFLRKISTQKSVT